MSTSNKPLQIGPQDLFSPEVEEYLEIQRSLRRDLGEVEQQPLFIRIVYSSWFYLAIASCVGALAGWAILEPFFNDNELADEGLKVAELLLFPTVAGCVGLFLGAAEGIMCRNALRAFISGGVGLGVGFIGGIVALIPAGIIFAVASTVALEFWENPQPDEMPTGVALLILMMGRAGAWSIVSIPAGLGQGLALREKRVIINGVIGGILGGLLGGLLFDPISFVFLSADGEASVSRAVGFACIGLLVGLFVGCVESWTKSAWLLMQKGPLAGKQFVLFRHTTVLGSAPNADIYLFKDEAIELRHALIHNRGGRFEIEDCDTADGTYVNGIAVHRQILEPGDRIVLGKTVLDFAVKESSR